MNELDSSLYALPQLQLRTGDFLIEQDHVTDKLYFLKSGKVRVCKDGHAIAVVSDTGAVFGDMSVLLGIPHSASVECLQDSSFYAVEDPAVFLQAHPAVLWHLARILGMRLFNLNQYLVNLKAQYQGHDHLGMVDEVLETLLNQQKTGTLKRGEGKRDVPTY